MNRIWAAGLLAAAGLLISDSPAPAQVFVRAPFVRVEVGGPGVHVRAPFVNLYVPSGPPPVYLAPAPPVQPKSPQKVKPAKPKANQNEAAPQPRELIPSKGMTLKEFAETFQARQGNYQVTLVNPLTKKPMDVQFSLPAGMPQQVQVTKNDVEFRYGPRRFVRIGFDEDGVTVTSRVP